jgi:hypothetical protein
MSSQVFASVQLRTFGVPPVDDVLVSGMTANATNPVAAGTGTGDVLMVWVEAGALKSVLRQQGGTMLPAQTIAASGVVGVPSVAWLGTGYAVAWSDGDDVHVQRVSAAGTAMGAPTFANASRRQGVQDQPAIAAFSTGEYFVAWRDSYMDDVGTDIRGQKFNAAGAPAGTIVASTLNDQNTAGDQATPAAVSGTNSKGERFFFIAWVDPTGQQVNGRVVAVDTDGFLPNPVDGHTNEFPIGVGAKPRSSPALAFGGMSPGFVAVAWSDDSVADPAGDDDRVRVRRLPLPDDF